ncbi:leucine-rich repeat domain-containing protein [Candidatus Lokiarchaeum ossiferum]|uniref:leucine-rich repeat domain-containing protein n=1 Tax=Candidatus Lokiarchaeum ossiferum TaxID=2951803 RepID=UPI00352FB1B0
MSKKLLKQLSDKSEKKALQVLISRLSLQEFNIAVENGHVIELILKYKNLTSIPEEISYFLFLKRLDLSRNRINSISRLNSLQLLEELYLRENDLSILENFETLSQLKILDLSNNQIDQIDGLYNQVNLDILDLSNNNIKKIVGLEKCYKLTELKLNRNNIKEISGLDSLEELRILFLANNSIEIIQGLTQLENLKELNLSLNKIRKLENLDRNSYLRTLNLSDNLITKIENLGHLNFLRELNLAGNNFSAEDQILVEKGAMTVVNHCLEMEKEHLRQINEKQKIAINRELNVDTEIMGRNQTSSLRKKMIGFSEKKKNPFLETPPSAANISQDPVSRNLNAKKPQSFFLPNKTPISESLDQNPVVEIPSLIPQKKPSRIKKKKKLPKIKTIEPKPVPVPNPQILPVLDQQFSTEEEWMEFGNTLNQKEDYRNALLAYRNVIQLNTKNVDAWMNSGIAFNNRGDYRRSIRAFKQSLAISAKHSTLWMYLGIGFYNVGDFAQAVKAFNESLSLESTNVLSLEYLAKIPDEYKKDLNLMEKQAEDLAKESQVVEDRLFKQLQKLSKAYQEISYVDLLPQVINPPYITDIQSLKHKISDLIMQQRFNAKMFLDHLTFAKTEIKTPEREVVKIGEKYNVKQLLAFTNYSKLWLAEDLDTREKYVLKHIIYKGNFSTRKLIEHMALREITLLSKIKSAQVIPLLKSFLGEYQDNFGYILQLPYYQYGTLERRIKEIEEKNPTTHKLMHPYSILTIFTGMVQAIIPIHRAGIVHRDIKPSNIIINSKAEIPSPQDIVYIDFGIATAPVQISGTDFTIAGGCGTHGFSAPEQLSSPHVDYSADVYAIAATIYYSMTLQKYKEGATFSDEIRTYYQSIHYLFPILERMLNIDPEVRCTGINMLKRIVKNLNIIISREVFKVVINL